MVITSIAEAEALLRTFVPDVKAFTGKNVTLARMLPLMQAAGNPEKKLKVIHVAGTSGKTSTCYFIGALLAATGSKVGVTVSPHIDSITERIQLNGKPISDELFCAYLGEYMDIVNTQSVQPSYFELMMAFAYWVFEKEHVDYAVIETGMGGLQDGSNVAMQPNKVCVITDIGFDHMHILGDTIAKIAAQKAGILHAGNVGFLFRQSHDVLQAIRNRAEAVGADYELVDAAVIQDFKNLPIADFQKRNVALACRVCTYVLNRDGNKTIPLQTAIEVATTYVPARMDTTTVGAKQLVMDGAHNGQKMEVFVDSFKRQYTNSKAAVLLALKEGKEYKEVLRALLPITDSLIVTTFNTSQDLPSRSCDPYELTKHAEAYGFKNVQVLPKHTQAYAELLQQKNDVCVITGSFYLIGQIRKTQKLQHVY